MRNLKFICSIYLVLILTSLTYSQVGIGTITPENSAILHLEADDKAFLPPRINLVNGKNDNVTIPNPTEGLMVYHTGNSLLIKGLYVWNGSAWGEMFGSLPPAPDFESPWLPFAAQNGENSYMVVNHGLGEIPAELIVEVRAVDGNNNGFIFTGVGSAARDDDPQPDGRLINYGAVVFASSINNVRLWAPDRNNDSNAGRCILVFDGWGGEVNAQNSNNCQVRIRAWKQWGKP